ncbi:MAG: glutamine amidotransferase [Acidimicrobiia bacterium]
MKKIKVGIIYPELLGTYGDRGNALAFAFRASKRNLETEIVEISPNDHIPTGLDIYFLGGGEDKAQTLATELLRKQMSALEEITSTSLLIGICAGFQILGSQFPISENEVYDGLDLIDVTTKFGKPRIIGELVIESNIPDVGLITGFENHGGRTSLIDSSKALGKVINGQGNGVSENDINSDGYMSENILCTYAHGPLLARNPSLCDWLLSRTLGIEMEELSKIEGDFSETLHSERLRNVTKTS